MQINDNKTREVSPRKRYIHGLLIALFVGFAGAAGIMAQGEPAIQKQKTDNSEQIAEIRRIYKKITLAVESGGAGVVRFYNRGNGWERQDSSQIDKQPHSSKTTPLSAATVYLQQEQIIRIVARHSSPEGITLRSYYFYDNGNTAYIFERRYIFSGPKSKSSSSFMKESKIYLSHTGEELDKQITWSRKPEGAEAPPAPEIHMNTKSFDFYPLLQEQLKKQTR